MRLATTCLFNAVIISIIESFSSSVKTYLNLVGTKGLIWWTNSGYQIKSVTYGSCSGVLNHFSGVHGVKEHLIELVDKGAVVDVTRAIVHLVAIDQILDFTLCQVES